MQNMIWSVATCLLAFGLACPISSFASSRVKNLPDDADMVSTPLGALPKATVRGFCAAPQVTVGTITTVSSNWQYHTSPGGSTTEFMMSQIILNAEAVLKGPVSPTVTLFVNGGTVGGTTVVPGPSFIQPEVGRRYVVGWKPLQLPGFPKQLILAVAAIDAGTVLPPDLESQFMEAVNQYCP